MRSWGGLRQPVREAEHERQIIHFVRRFNFCVDWATYNRICFLLTDDERAVLDYRRRGLGNAEIAAEMNCSERTVNRLVRAVVDKIRKI